MDTEAHVRLPGTHGYGGTRTVARGTWIRRQTYGCQRHMDMEAHVRLPGAHGYGGTRTVARGTWIRRHTYGCQGTWIRRHTYGCQGTWIRRHTYGCQGHMDTEAHVRLPGARGAWSSSVNPCSGYGASRLKTVTFPRVLERPAWPIDLLCNSTVMASSNWLLVCCRIHNLVGM